MRGSLTTALTAKDETSVILLAVDAQGARLGFVYALLTVDLFTDAPQAHISDLVVSEEAEGRGVGRALRHAIERWALGHGASSITLHVFPGNARALALYTQRGYATQWLQLYKPLAAETLA
jgi:ribosomal protein S18 acetylase RimI-like enzyme